VAENVATRAVQVGEAPTGLAAGIGAVLVGDEDGVIRRVDEDTRQVTEIPFGAEILGILGFREEGRCEGSRTTL